MGNHQSADDPDLTETVSRRLVAGLIPRLYQHTVCQHDSLNIPWKYQVSFMLESVYELLRLAAFSASKIAVVRGDRFQDPDEPVALCPNQG